MEWLITTQQDAAQYALDEMRELGDWSPVKSYSGGDSVTLMGGEQDLARAFNKKPPIFIRHVCPVHLKLALPDKKNAGLTRFRHAAAEILPMLDMQKTFSVQTRAIGDMEYKRFEINDAVSSKIMEAGFTLSVREPEQVVSVAVGGGIAYIGVSLAKDNLSDWAGGAHRFKYEPGQLSRAEFKLLEAISLFRIDIRESEKALDLGAAPGGWTRVLRQRGLCVTAVDPAALHESLANDSMITYYARTAQQFVKDCAALFHMIVNDMRMDALQSSELMCGIAPLLSAGGVALMTLKLAEKHQLRQARASLDLLAQTYAIRGARQLFHNRSEVTVLLARLGEH